MPAPIFNNKPPRGCVGIPYSFTWGTTPSAAVQLVGNLPSGLTMLDNTISGVPDKIGEWPLTALTVTDTPAIKTFSIIISPKIFKGCYLQE